MSHALLIVSAVLASLLVRHGSALCWNPSIDTIWTVTDWGSRVDWSGSGNDLIAFDRLRTDGFYDVSQMTPEGTEILCLTDYPGLRNLR